MNALHELCGPEAPAEPNPELSVVISLYNEYEVIGLLHKRLKAVLQNLNVSYELVLVDDGSRDGTPHEMARLSELDETVTAVFLSRNFGKEAALTAGLDHAGGAAVIIMDADLQDPPEMIPEMLQAWRNGADVVCMRRRT